MEEVCFDSNAGDWVFGVENQVSQPRNIFYTGENTVSKNIMSKFTDRTKRL